jgi:hypothetical protein
MLRSDFDESTPFSTTRIIIAVLVRSRCASEAYLDGLFRIYVIQSMISHVDAPFGLSMSETGLDPLGC